MALPPQRVSFGGTVLGVMGRQARGFALTNGKAVRLHITPAQTLGRRAAAPFPVRRSPLRAPVAVSRAIKKEIGDPTSRAGRGTTGLRGTNTGVRIVSQRIAAGLRATSTTTRPR